MKREQKYYTVKEIKTGRFFQAEYDSESAAYYEKGTGKEYDITEVEDLGPSTIQQAANFATSSSANARDFLQSAGIMTKDGKLHQRYK